MVFIIEANFGDRQKLFWLDVKDNEFISGVLLDRSIYRFLLAQSMHDFMIALHNCDILYSDYCLSDAQ